MNALKRQDAPLYLVGGAVVSTILSIAAFEILMGLALLALILNRRRFRLPRLWIPLALFMSGTLISLAASGHWREGMPQIRKFYVYLMLFLVTSAFQTVRQIRWVAVAWSLAAAIAALWSLVQFVRKYEAAQTAHRSFYNYYVADRITGFAGHWMTLGGELMIALLIIASIVLLSTDRRAIAWLIAAALPVALALEATWTRSMWLGAFCGGLYLIWFWRRWALLAAPCLIALLLLANPFGFRERALSAFTPHGATDSNEHREELRAIGWRMIQAHPWLGVGPEQVPHQVQNYLPPGDQTPRSGEYYGHLENDYLQYAAERGVPTTLALLWMIGWALFDFTRTLLRLPKHAEERWVLHAAIAVTLAVLISGFYSWNLNASSLLAMFLAVLGCGYAVVLRPDPSG
jgi:putative inorganic carbon (HCO3(-)) transporter